MRLSLVAGLLVAATIVPGAADAGPVRAAAAGTATAVTVTSATSRPVGMAARYRRYDLRARAGSPERSYERPML